MKPQCLLFLVLIGLAVLGTLPATAQESASPKPLIIDTDMAMDDWMGILYLLQRSDVQVLAVTVSGTGEAYCDPGVQNAMNLLALAGNPDIPVACGRETPLKGNNVFPQEWRDAVNVMYGHELPANPNTPVDLTAVELLQQTINDSPEKVTLLVLGPQTNIAEMIQAAPAVVERIAMIYAMGGAVDVPGNVNEGDNTVAEWNAYVDPLALSQVIASGVPVTLIPLDATTQTPLNAKFYRALSADLTTPEAEFVQAVLKDILPYMSYGYSFWDQLAAVTVTDERVVTIEERTISVITDDGTEFGRTQPDPNGQPVRVAVGADAALFEQIFLNVLNGRAAEAAKP
ncbi:MAG: nucleoside hydrolase [Anaerolineae bacterium]|nr:nucleoside hydrolase [Anaerolineae bacterium]